MRELSSHAVPPGWETETVTSAPPSPASRGRSTVRSTILIAVLALTAVALAAAGITAAILQDIRVRERVDAELATFVDGVRALAESGTDPRTGEAITTDAQLVRAAMAQTIPSRNEGLVGVVNGKIEFTSSAAPVRFEDDPVLVTRLGELLDQPTPTIASVRTSTTTYRLAAVPVLVDGDDPVAPTGVVVGYDLTAERGEFREVFRTYSLIAALSLIVVGLVGWLVAGRLLRPIRTLAETAHNIGRDDLSERIPVTGQDDLARMTIAVNDMLERLEQAFADQRELVGDVSHELRTPLTVVRGNLELMDPDDPEDVRAVRALILDEVSRMNRVVDDLTTLATVEQPGFTRLAPVEVGLLTDEVFDKALALGPRQWTIAARAEATVTADRERLTQAWLQLATNAVKFSEPGTRIELGSSLSDGVLSLWVADDGPGIYPADHERIFQRFERAGDRSTQGSGLGLAIVRAIAEAHGGAVAVDSKLGSGATFTITLPEGVTG